MHNKGRVIFLNGPSSSGKTTLAHALQAKLPDPYLHIGIDKLIGMMPSHLNNWEGGKADEGFWWKSAYDSDGNLLQHIQLGSYARKISQLLKNMVVTMIDNGFNVIVDEVCVGENSAMIDWKSMLANCSVLYVGKRSIIYMSAINIKYLRLDNYLGSLQEAARYFQAPIYSLTVNSYNRVYPSLVRYKFINPSGIGV